MSRVRPILFNTDMVQAVMDGRKTATRRIIKPQPGKDQNHKLGVCIAGDRRDTGKFAFGSSAQGGNMLYVRPPYQPGDILYVRETWGYDVGGIYIYKASYKECFTGNKETDAVGNKIRWYPSIHMPKEAARIWLRVKGVRVEHLQEMNADSLKSEGFMKYSLEDFKSEFDRLAVKFEYENAQKRFAALWDSTMPRGQQALYGWDADPWVWTIDFERCGKPESGE